MTRNTKIIQIGWWIDGMIGRVGMVLSNGKGRSVGSCPYPCHGLLHYLRYMKAPLLWQNTAGGGTVAKARMLVQVLCNLSGLLVAEFCICVKERRGEERGKIR